LRKCFHALLSHDPLLISEPFVSFLGFSGFTYLFLPFPPLSLTDAFRRCASIWHAFPNVFPQAVKVGWPIDVLPTVATDDMSKSVTEVLLGMFLFSRSHREHELFRSSNRLQRFSIVAVPRVLAAMRNHRVRDHEAEPEGFRVCRNAVGELEDILKGQTITVVCRRGQRVPLKTARSRRVLEVSPAPCR
jgi:hypothetical protein